MIKYSDKSNLGLTLAHTSISLAGKSRQPESEAAGHTASQEAEKEETVVLFDTFTSRNTIQLTPNRGAQ